MSMGLYQPSAPEIFDLTDRRPPKSVPKPVLGDIRCAVNVHQSTEGRFRFRFSITKETFAFITAGLSDPRIRVEGDVGCGLKLVCSDKFGVKPTYSGQQIIFSVPIRSLRGRESNVPATPVAYEKAYDDNGPVLLIPQMPESFLPDKLLNKIPSSRRETVMGKAFKEADEASLRDAANQLFKTVVQQDGVCPAPEPKPVPTAAPEPKPIPVAIEAGQLIPDFLPHPDQTVERNVDDLRAAIAMVNEIVAEIGQDIVLFTCQEGRTLHARRRVTQFIDL